MFSARGSFTVMNFGTRDVLSGPTSESLSQPWRSDTSIARSGPQPNWLLSGPLKAATLPPLAWAAQSWCSAQFSTVGCEPTLTLVCCSAYMSLRANTAGYVPGMIPSIV